MSATNASVGDAAFEYYKYDLTSHIISLFSRLFMLVGLVLNFGYVLLWSQTGVPPARLERGARLHGFRESLLADLRDTQPVPALHARRAVHLLHDLLGHRQRYRFWVSIVASVDTSRRKIVFGPIHRRRFCVALCHWRRSNERCRFRSTTNGSAFIFLRRCGHLDLRHVSFSRGRRFTSTHCTLKRKAGINRKIDMWQG